MTGTSHLDDNEPPTVDDLRVLTKEIHELLQLGDNKIVAEAHTAILRLIHASAKRLRKHHR